jgi:chromosome partitioning protein
MALVITVANLKGGVGKTTTACAIAEAASYGGPVVLFDCDPQGSALDWSQRASGSGNPFRSTVRGMAAPDLRRRIERETANYAVAVVDAPPPGALDIARSAIDIADILVMPCPPNFADLARIPATQAEAAKHGIPAGVVLTMVRSGLADRSAAVTVLTNAGVRVFATWLPLTVAVARAYGQPVTGTLAAYGISLMGEILNLKEAEQHG